MEYEGKKDSAGCMQPQAFPEAYLAGKEIGTKLSNGLIDEAAQLYTVEKNKLVEVQKEDLHLGQRMGFDFVLGMKCTDPTDIHINMQSPNSAMADMDAPAEILTNQVLALLNKFSTYPVLDYSNVQFVTVEQAIQKINDNLQDPRVWTKMKDHPLMREDFVEDFNRRRQIDNYLPDFEAYIDQSDNQVKIRHLIRS